eukprot:6492238-Amphidinium_carterae.3
MVEKKEKAVVATPAAKKRKAIDLAHTEDKSVIKGPRIRPDRTVEAEVKQALYDNARLFTQNQLDCIVVGGCHSQISPFQKPTLRRKEQRYARVMMHWLGGCFTAGETARERVTKEKEACRKENRKTGSLFWRKFRADYGNGSSNSKDPVLKIAPESTMPEPLWSAFK